MNQTPAALLILAASVCGYAAGTRGPDTFGVAIGLAGVAFAAWGVLSLVSASTRPRQSDGDRSDSVHLAFPGLAAHQPLPDKKPGLAARRGVPTHLTGRLSEESLSPEISAQLSLVAHMQGQDRTQILEDLLRRHLPRYTNHQR